MPLSKMVQIGGYAMLLKEVTDRVVTMKNRRQIARRRENTRNLLIGASIGTALSWQLGSTRQSPFETSTPLHPKPSVCFVGTAATWNS